MDRRTRRERRFTEDTDSLPFVPGEDEEEVSVPGSSIEELTQEADRNQFDRTFLSDGAQMDILGEFDAAPGSKQVVPRMAYTINLNMVWNPDRERWEPDEGKIDSGVLQEADAAQPQVQLSQTTVDSTTGEQPTTDVTVS